MKGSRHPKSVTRVFKSSTVLHQSIWYLRKLLGALLELLIRLLRREFSTCNGWEPSGGLEHTQTFPLAR